ncbi:MAG: hypothetical protein E6I82_00725 [Chloroflexi bacterium]|nr:MAG: hypothetical protein E6I82_00725 [Chloroflexota bacterium]
MSERETAGGELGLIQAFVNTVDLDPGVEELKDPNTLRAWLVANKLMPGHHPVDDSDLKNALAVREAMRGVRPGDPQLGRRGQPPADAFRTGWQATPRTGGVWRSGRDRPAGRGAVLGDAG